MARSTTLKKSNCNGVVIETEKVVDKHGEYFTVSIIDRYDAFAEANVFDECSEADALERHDALVEEFKDKPNWGAQAAYDEAHGTINGEDAGMVAMWELFGC